MKPKKAPTGLRSRGKHWARRTHRLLGVSSLIFLLIISVTGILLNHAESLGLSKRSASNPLLVRLYGIDPLVIDAAFAANGLSFVSSDRVLYVEGKRTATDLTPLVGVVETSEEIIAGTSSELLVLTSDGVLVERFTPELPAAISRLGLLEGQPLSEIDLQFYAIDARQMQLAEILPVAESAVQWSQNVEPPAHITKAVSSAALGQVLSVERVLSDLHSGRLLPTIGRYVADLAALCLIYLCITGSILWFRRRYPGDR